MSFGKNTDLNWEVSKEGIYIPGAPASDTSDYKAIVRSDNNELLSVKKKSYCPPSIAEFKDRTQEIVDITGFNLAGFEEYNGGRTVLGFLENTSDTFEVAGHKMKNYMVIGNSYNGATSFFVGTSDVYMRCTNQFSRLLKAMKVRNSKNSKARRDTLMKEIEVYYNGSNELYTMYNEFGDRVVSNDLKEEIALSVLGLNKDEIGTNMQTKLDTLMANINSECNELGDNLWGVFNGVTWYTTHEMTQKNDVSGNIFGKKSMINNQAFKVCTDLVNA